MKQPLAGQIFMNDVGSVRVVERESVDLTRVFWVRFDPRNPDDYVSWGACSRGKLKIWGKRLEDTEEVERILEDYRKNRIPRLTCAGYLLIRQVFGEFYISNLGG